MAYSSSNKMELSGQLIKVFSTHTEISYPGVEIILVQYY